MPYSGHEASIPAARTIDLLTTTSNDLVVVCDRKTHHIHHLDPIVATIWRLCDGHRTMADIASATGLDAEVIQGTLRKLEDAHLLNGRISPVSGGQVKVDAHS